MEGTGQKERMLIWGKAAFQVLFLLRVESCQPGGAIRPLPQGLINSSPAFDDLGEARARVSLGYVKTCLFL
jgi:hypothetical protein